jgi:hypothetical protein
MNEMGSGRSRLLFICNTESIGYPAFEYWAVLPDLPLPPGYAGRIYECLVNDMIKRLEAVENTELKDIRDYCLKQLR